MITLDDAWNSYLLTRPLTRNGYLRDTSRYRAHLAEYWHGKNLASIRTADIQKYTLNLYNKGLCPQTIKLCLSQMRRIMRRALILDLYTGEIPFFEMPFSESIRYRYLDENEAKVLLKKLETLSHLWYNISKFALNTGMRAGEIFSLRGENINFSQKSVILYETKNKRQRLLPLNDVALEIIDGHMTRKENFIFFQEKNPKKKYEKVSKVFRKAVYLCKLNDGVTDNRYKVVFHTLRHTFASWLVQRGTPLFVVSKLLGHSSTKVTERYSHLAPDQGRSALSMLSAIF